MKIFHGSKEAKGKLKKPVVALGNFDGIHLAHRKMFALTHSLAKEVKGTPAVYTFDPHPVKFLSPETAPPLITTLDQKIELIAKNKMKALILEPFSAAFAKLSPEAFFTDILCKQLSVAGVVAGYDFTFGAKRTGTVETLEKLCRDHRVACRILDAFLLGNSLVSSSQVRNLIRQGMVERARDLLGHRFEIVGTVMHGEGIGASLGFPTANILVENELLPATGVYATQVRLGLRRYLSVTNIGYRPTFGGRRLTVETHLIGFKKKIYGQKIRLKFDKRIREEMAFATPEDLIHQIRRDVEEAKKILK
ncbi:MAG: bifunctional riboflavin kinase/FAD synthetase [bacterium]